MALETPEAGGRVVLTRGTVSDDEVTYAVVLHAPKTSWESEATISIADGAITFSPELDPEVPSWLSDMARAFLRTLWSGRRKENPPIWPRRLRRWRAPKP